MSVLNLDYWCSSPLYQIFGYTKDGFYCKRCAVNVGSSAQSIYLHCQRKEGHLDLPFKYCQEFCGLRATEESVKL